MELLLAKNIERLRQTKKREIEIYGIPITIKTISKQSYCPHFDEQYQRCVKPDCPYYPTGLILEFKTFQIKGLYFPLVGFFAAELEPGYIPAGGHLFIVDYEHFDIIENVMINRIPIKANERDFLVNRMRPDVLRIALRLECEEVGKVTWKQ